MIDQFHSKHALANTLNQLQPQKLSTNVWLGPLNSIAQNDFCQQTILNTFWYNAISKMLLLFEKFHK